MVSRFYKRHARSILWIVALSFPLVFIEAESIPRNNDIETWLPRDAAIRRTFNAFQRDFGADETVLIAIPKEKVDPRLAESLATRLEALPGIRRCWTAERLRVAMKDLQVPEKEIEERLRGFIVSEDGKRVALAAVMSKDGVKDRLHTVRKIREQMEYCQVSGDETAIAGPPVVVAELDRLGNTKSNTKFFLVTLAICLGLLYYSLRDWKLTGAILGITVWAIKATMTIVKYSGAEMNFILGALPVMVMVFTLAACVHMLHYYQAASREDDPLQAAFLRAWKPCFLATLTTTIGLLSLTISDIRAVQTFGTSAAIGSVVALLAGLGLMPAVLVVCKVKFKSHAETQGWFSRVAHWIVARNKSVAVATGLLVALTAVGLMRLRSRIEPLDFLPPDNVVLADTRSIEKDFVKLNSIEVVVDFGEDDAPVIEKLRKVREIEASIRKHHCVYQTMSAATFLPSKMPDDPWESAEILKTARDRWSDGSDYIADGGRLWRISARISYEQDRSRRQVIEELTEATASCGYPVTYTGMAPLLEEAQKSIFTGFWESFLSAFLIITLIMIVSLKSLKTGLVAMIPNLTPLCIVFGILGWLDFPVDIGMMMTGSIALGIAVDGTFHFLVDYTSRLQSGDLRADASRGALLQTGAPIFKAAVIAAIGMLALTMSNFVPTVRFGYMMATLLLAALIGDLVLLPALLALRSSRREKRPPVTRQSEPAFAPTIPVPHARTRSQRRTNV